MSNQVAARLLGSAFLCALTACGGAGGAVGGADRSNAGHTGAAGALPQAIGYFKASNTSAGGLFGTSVSLSSDGTTLAVGAPGESSSATGVGGDQASRGAGGSGAVYVFTRLRDAWVQQAYVKASNTKAGDHFGDSVSLSGDGNTLAVGADFEDSLGTGINGHQGSIAENSSNRGAVYVFTRSGGNWSQQAYVKADGGHDNAYFGRAVSLNSDGNTLAVGATGESTGALDAGAVYVFARSGSVWSQQAFVKPSNILSGAHFGSSVALNGDGDTLAAGAPDEYDGANTGGTVYVFTPSAGVWSQQALVKASDTAAFDVFGDSVALSSEGNTLAVGARDEFNGATGGAVYVFTRSAGTWSQQASVEASNTAAGDTFGRSVALSSDGNTLAVGALVESSGATGINGNQTDNSTANAGAVYVLARSTHSWSQRAYVKASNTGAGDGFGSSVALSSDGHSLAVGAFNESSGATGIGGNQTDNNATGAGAVYLY
jgi:FG-GAP repeat protein